MGCDRRKYIASRYGINIKHFKNQNPDNRDFFIALYLNNLYFRQQINSSQMKLNFTLKACAATLIFTAFGAYGQTPAKRFGREIEFTKCGTTQYEGRLQAKNPSRPSKSQFEQWLAPKIEAEKARRQLMRNGENTNTVVT